VDASARAVWFPISDRSAVFSTRSEQNCVSLGAASLAGGPSRPDSQYHWCGHPHCNTLPAG